MNRKYDKIKKRNYTIAVIVLVLAAAITAVAVIVRGGYGVPVSGGSSGTSAPYYGVYELSTLECISAANTTERIAPASLTKIVTACTALKYASADTVFEVGTELELVHDGSSLCYISQGQRLTLRDLIAGMMLASGNDAAYTVAVNTARLVCSEPLSDTEAVRYFADLMNSFAADVDAADSHFTDPDGWDDEQHYTTVADIARFSACAMKHPEIRDCVALTDTYRVFETGENVTWVNTNKLLQKESPYYCPSALGLKTGTTPRAGNCLSAVFERDGKEYIVIAAGCCTDEERYKAVLDLYDKIK